MSAAWERVKPQWVRHADGYQVYSDGRYRIAYEDDRGKVVIAAERLTGAVELSAEDILWEAVDGTTRPVADADRALILNRTVEGLDFMGAHPILDKGS